MPYATVTDLQDRLGEARLVQLTDLSDPPLGLVDAAVAGKALDDAQAEIDGYLVGRYALPMAEPVPGVLRVHALTLACLRLLGSQVDEATTAEAKAARDYLLRVARGDVVLLPPSVAAAPAGLGQVMFNAGQKVMARDAVDRDDCGGSWL